jgi:hypothetical protein
MPEGFYLNIRMKVSTKLCLNFYEKRLPSLKGREAVTSGLVILFVRCRFSSINKT